MRTWRRCRECNVAPITHPSEWATRCQSCEAAAQMRWFAWLATLPETRIYDPGMPNPDHYLTGSSSSSGRLPDLSARPGRLTRPQRPGRRYAG